MSKARKKKLAKRDRVVAAVIKTRAELDGEYRTLSRMTGVPHRSIQRWREWQGRGVPLLSFPGPKKVAPLEIENLMADLLALAHGHRRTAGTGALYTEFRDQLSRRVLGEVVSGLRKEYFHIKAALQRRILWQTPGLVWSMDDMEMNWLELGFGDFDPAKVFWHQVRDLGSRRQFPSLVTTALAPGVVVAERLARLFRKYGPPLFIKRDNGGNLNHAAVDKELSDFMVIPINSPPYYPPYNGGIEKSQREFKTELRGIFQDRPWPVKGVEDALSLVQLGTKTVWHELNQWRRPCLQGRTANLVFEVGKQNRRYYYDQRQRRAVFDELRTMAAMSMAETKLTGRRAADAAWRLAVETWLRREGHITISVGRKVLPYFP